jgi:hypothetical protein
LARPKQYPLTDAERANLIQVVEGFTGQHDHEVARRGIEWMREHYRWLGQAPGSDAGPWSRLSLLVGFGRTKQLRDNERLTAYRRELAATLPPRSACAIKPATLM